MLSISFSLPRFRSLLSAATSMLMPLNGLGGQAGYSLDVERAAEHYNSRQFSAAKALLDSVIQRDPRDAGAAYYLGRLALLRGRSSEAVSWLELAVEREGRRSEYHQYLGRAYARDALAGSKLRLPFVARRSRREFVRAVELDPDNVSAREDLGQYYLVAPGILGGDRRAAETQASEIFRRNPMRGHIARGALAMKDGDAATAEGEYHEATAVAPDSAASHLALGSFLRERKRYAEALIEFENSAKIGAHDAWFEIGRTSLLGNLDYSQGAAAIRRYLTLEPGEDEPSTITAHLWLGRLYERLSQFDRAAAEYDAVLAIDPNNRAAMKGAQSLRDRRP